MLDASYPWNASWYRNMQIIEGFADAVSLTSDISADHYKFLMGRRALRIENLALQRAIFKHAANLADLLDWIQTGVQNHNKCVQVPEFLMLETRDFVLHRDTWVKHVTVANQSKLLHELKTLVDALLEELREKRAKFDSEDTGGFSSYSDYSEDETESGDDEENEYYPDSKDKAHINEQKNEKVKRCLA